MVSMMKKFQRMAAVLAVLVMTAGAALAQNRIKVEVRPDALVSLDENFQVTFTIEGANLVRDFQWEPGDDFHLVWGPARSSSTSTTLINGKREMTSRQSYTYTLKPLRVGTFPIAQASATIDGNNILSDLASVTVIAGEDGRTEEAAAAASAPSASSDAAAVASKGEDIFIRMIPSKRRVIVGEPFRFEIKLYTKLDISGLTSAKFPSFDNFSKKDDDIGEVQFHREDVGGTIYYVATVASYTLTPLKAGTLPIEAAELGCTYLVRNAPTGDPLEDFFGTGSRQMRRTLRAPGVDIEVSRLPGGAPDSFTGAVGSYKMEASLSSDHIRENEAGSLHVRISGTGNIAMVTAPSVALPQGFDTYGTESKFDSRGSVTGTQSFDYPFIPRTDGEFRVGPVEFSYFDTDSRSYKTLRAGPFDLTVDRDTTGVAPVATVPGGAPRIGGTRVETKAESIRYIRTRMPSDLGGRRSFWVARPLYWCLLGALLLGLLIYLPASAAIYRRRADLSGTKNRRAAKLASSRLKTARVYLKKNLHTAFYEELHRAMLGYASDKLLLDVSQLSRDGMKAALLEGGAREEAVEGFLAQLDACEYARYAPGGDTSASMREQYDATVRALSDIDATVKKPAKSSGRHARPEDRHARPDRASVGLLLLLLTLPATLRAAEPVIPGEVEESLSAEALWTAGVEAYADGRYADAARDWTVLAADAPESADLWYNIGNASYQIGDYAHAVLGYERALRLDPSFDDARYNLERVAEHLDKIDAVPESPLRRAASSVSHWLPANTWALLAALFFVGALALALAFFRSGRRGWRIAGFYGGIAALLLFAGTLWMSIRQYREYTAKDQQFAVVMLQRTSVRNAPSGSGSIELFELHAGTKVELLDEMNGWTEVRIADGNRGWLRSADIEEI